MFHYIRVAINPDTSTELLSTVSLVSGLRLGVESARGLAIIPAREQEGIWGWAAITKTFFVTLSTLSARSAIRSATTFGLVSDGW